ncbi:hypothetical protein ILUMI_10022 [Ignelater luminosus]|uniref:t-SNARE coiled-coil homology domain-containing protein n=1 Tax=Ignelater luminosus TaxID=2038154 RepID=A0A8K0GE07_IGNLU|nr:hypothetical protein ILUMI_10022 [Ignelater luminosus]
MALLNLGDDPWLIEFESCEKLHRDIMEMLSLRQREPRSTEKYAQISATIRSRLKQYHLEVNQLKQKIDQATRTRAITFEETERRTRQIEILQSKAVNMQKMFDEHNTGVTRDRSQLLGPTGVSSWVSDDDELVGGEASQYTVEQLRDQQKQMLRNQDEGLENLSKIISRQKNIAQTISSEVDLQNEIIDDLGDHIDRTDARVVSETRTIGTIDRKDKTCIYWVIIILLFISIITVVAI